MVWQKNSPKANYPRPLFTAAPLPKKPFIEQSQNRSREKTISYEETLELTLEDLVQQLTTISRYFFDLNKENIEPDQRSQEN